MSDGGPGEGHCHNEWPALRGGLVALGAAVLFGVSTPLVQLAGAQLGAFTTAALLYGGAAIIGGLVRKPVQQEAAMRRGDLGRVAWMALLALPSARSRWPGGYSTPAGQAPR